MKLKIIMDSGKEYIIDSTIEMFNRSIRNDIGILQNAPKYIDNGIIVMPTHISSIEEVKE